MRPLLLWPLLASAAAAQPAEPPPVYAPDAHTGATARLPPDNPARFEELEARIAELEARESAAQAASPFEIYGYLSLGFFVLDALDAGVSTLLERPAGFHFAALNVYQDYHPTPNWRVLSEIRFQYEPNGDELTAAYKMMQGGGIPHHVSLNEQTGSREPYGSILIERAQVEWTPLHGLGVRAGIFLTPFGIWNVDHGAPALVPVRAPFSVLLEPFPKRQLGAQLFGHMDIQEMLLYWTVYLSNGRNDTELQYERDVDKAIGLRLTLSDAEERASAGLSFYRGGYSERPLRLASLDPLRFERTTSVDSVDTAVGADLRVRWGRLESCTEAIGGRTVYSKGKRAPSLSQLGYQPDYQAFSSYELLVLALPVEPIDLRAFTLLNAVWLDGVPELGFNRWLLDLSLGLNYRPSPPVTLKASYTHLMDLDPPVRGFQMGDLDAYDFQLAVAF